MAMGGKGPGLVIALGSAKPKGEAEPEGGKEKGGGVSITAAKALLKAIEAGDAAAVDEALSLHRELCMGGEYEDD